MVPDIFTEAVFIFGYGRLDCLAVSSGQVVWSYRSSHVLTRDAPSDICRWRDCVVVGTEAHVLCVRAHNGVENFAFRLPSMFRSDRPLRVVAHGELLVVHDRAVIAGVAYDGSLRWVSQFALEERGRMPSVLFGEQTRSGELLTSFARLGL